jgi:TfoX/Sxy family transcriptional regulator of competence genes
MYDEELSDRLREALEGMAGVSERRMMGGLCFMLNGNMLGGAHREKSGEQLFMFRVGKESEAEALARPGAMPMQLGDRSPMRGFIFVDASLCDDSQLKGWVSLALAYISTLPPK